MAQFTTDLSHLPHDLRISIREKLGNEEAARLAVAKANQIRMQKIYSDAAQPGTTKDGFGPCTMIMDRGLAAQYRLMFGERCFEDQEWVKWMLRQSPEMKVRAVGTKIQVGYSAPVRSVRYSKTYGR